MLAIPIASLAFAFPDPVRLFPTLSAWQLARRRAGLAAGKVWKGIELTDACRQGVVIHPVIGIPSGEHKVDPSLLATWVKAANQSSTVSLPRKASPAASKSRVWPQSLDSQLMVFHPWQVPEPL